MIRPIGISTIPVRALRFAALLVPIGGLLAANPAEAHLVVEGSGEFTAGLLHPFFVLAHVLVIVGLGLLLAQQSLTVLERVAPWLTGALIGGLAGAGFDPVLPFELRGALLGLAVALGLLVALARPLPTALTGLLAALSCFTVGLDSPPETGDPWTDAVALAGTGLSICFLLFNVVALGAALKRPWQAIGIRVLGSWIGAAALMVSALALRGG